MQKGSHKMMAIHPQGTTLDFSILLEVFWDKTLRQSHFGSYILVLLCLKIMQREDPFLILLYNHLRFFYTCSLLFFLPHK